MGQTILTILVAILSFGLIILIHELGHFLVAKWSGIKVNEFSIGMGPAICKFGKKETKYCIRLIPMGGYVSMEGEDEESTDENAFNRKPVWKRILVVVAGAVMNVLLGLVILASLVMMKDTIGTKVVAKFNEGATSSQELMVGDEILRINGSPIFIDNDIVYELLRDKDGVVDMTVKRDGKRVELKNVTFQMEELEDGQKSLVLDFKVFGEQKTFGNAIKQTFCWTGSVIKLVWTSLIDLITGNFSFNQLSGPVGVATVIGQSARMGLSSYLLIIAFITINIGVFNLLPIPALDGGRLVFLIIEGIRRKPVPAKYEGYVHMAGFALLILIMVLVTYQDILRLLKG